MKFKKFIILMFFILISFLTINMVNSTECESEAANIVIQQDELNDKNTNFCCDMGNSRLWGGGGIANFNIGIGSGATGGGGGGAAVIALTIFL